MENGGPQIDAGIENLGYKDFFYKVKSLLNGDLSNIALPKAAQKIFKSIFDARLGNTTDGYPNYDGWRGDGKVNTPVKEISNVTSD